MTGVQTCALPICDQDTGPIAPGQRVRGALGEDGAERMPRLGARSGPRPPRTSPSPLRQSLQPTAPAPGHRPRCARARQPSRLHSPVSERRSSRRAGRPYPRVLPGGRVIRLVPGEAQRSACWRHGGQGITQDFCFPSSTVRPPAAPHGGAFSASHRHAAAAISLRVATDRRDRDSGALHLRVGSR